MSTQTEHKPLPVAGYQPQSDEKIDLANEGKELEERVLRWLEKLQIVGNPSQGEAGFQIDNRFLALGKTNIQQGFMWAVRSIFQPGRVKLPEDQA